MGEHDGHRARLRKRFLDHGLENFADHEVLELLLCFCIPRVDVNPLAHRLIDQFGGLEEVLCAPAEELGQVKGVGEQAVTLLRLIYPAYHKARFSGNSRPQILNSTAKAGNYLLSLFAGVREERMYQLCLDAKGKLLQCRLLSAVVLSHNHPSGVALPSREDMTTTRLAADALRTVDVQLIDHIIVADEDFVSMRESGIEW